MTSVSDELPKRAPFPDSPAWGPPTKMRALTLIYHEDLEDDITAIIHRQMVVARYTRIRDVIGARADFLEEHDYKSEGKNHMLFVIGRQEVVNDLVAEFRALRDKHGHGVRGYVTPVRDVI